MSLKLELYLKKYKKYPQNITYEAYQNKYGETIAMIILRYTDLDILEKFQHDSNIKDCFGYTIDMIYMEKRKNIPPKWMIRDDPEYQNFYGYTSLMYFIKYVNGEIPSYMLYKPYKQIYYDEDFMIDLDLKIDEYPLMEKDLTDIGNTEAMLWIKYRQTECPKELLHDPNIQNGEGQTLAMIWSIYISSTIPENLQHDPSIKDKFGDTITTYEIVFNKKIPDQWTKSDNIYKSWRNLTYAAQFIIYLQQSPPDSLQHDPNIDCNGHCVAYHYLQMLKNKKNNTLMGKSVNIIPEWMKPDNLDEIKELYEEVIGGEWI